jgi:hypothetical protein
MNSPKCIYSQSVFFKSLYFYSVNYLIIYQFGGSMQYFANLSMIRRTWGAALIHRPSPEFAFAFALYFFG